MRVYLGRDLDEATSQAYFKMAKEAAGEPSGYGCKRVVVFFLGIGRTVHLEAGLRTDGNYAWQFCKLLD